MSGLLITKGVSMRRLVLLTVLMLGAAAARAEDGFFYLGAGVSHNSAPNGAALAAYDVFAIPADIKGTSWKAFAGVRPIKQFAVEADYMDLGSGHSAGEVGGMFCFDLSSVGQSCDFDAHSHGTAYAGYLVGFLPIPLPNWDIYAKAGAAHWKLNGYIVQGASSSFSESGTDFAWGIGVQVHITKFGARLEYEAFNIPNTSGAKVASLSVFLNL